MKTFTNYLTILILSIISISCSENDSNLLIGAKENDISKETDCYYWLNGSKINIKSLKNIYYISSENDLNGLKLPERLIDVTSSFLKESKSSEKPSQSTTNWKIIYTPNDSRAQTDIQDLIDNYDICVAPVFGESIQNCIPSSEFFYAKALNNDREKMLTFAKANDTKVLLEFMPDWYLLKAPSKSNGLEMSNLFYESGVVSDVDPGFLINYQTSSIPSDPLFSSQYYLNTITAPSAWDITKGKSTVKVAIVDTGIDRRHNEISNNVSYNSYDMMHSSHELYYYSEHGTQVAGIIASNHNDIQISGVAPNVEIISIGVNMSDNYRPYTPWNLAAAINYATNNGADIINCSWGDFGGAITEFQLASTVMEEAISNALNEGRNGKGAIVIFAAGNTGKAVVDYPASCSDDLLVVGSIDQNNKKSYFSSYGHKIDVVAPGEDILSITPQQGTDYLTGTSASAPQATGAAALILSINPNLTGLQVRDIIESSATQLNASRFDTPNIQTEFLNNTLSKNGWRNGVFGYGIVNIEAALLKAQETL